MNLNNDEIGKYKKRKDRCSKSNRKSKHIHNYQPCVFVCNNPDYLGRGKEYYYLGSYCEICNKIKNCILTREETLEEFENLPLFKISSIFDKYVDFDKCGKEN